MPDTQTTIEISHLGRVFVSVSDQDRALAFYVGTLGFEKRVDVPFGDGERWIEVAPAGGVTALALVTPRESNPPGIETNVALSTPDADAAHAGLAASGVDVDEQVMRWGDPVPPMFRFRDPDGNSLTIVEER
jgi:catechol 2,3-dioxygenase-like lactoylglutathione lyase family enzyme